MFQQTPAKFQTTTRSWRKHPGFRLSLVAGVLASLVLAMAPAQAQMRMPQIRLTGGGPTVTATYTASTPGYRWARGVTPRYQWYRGAASGNTSTFRAIPHANNRRYTLKTADHGHRVRVAIRAVRSGKTLGRGLSPSSNRILHEVTAPKLSGIGPGGQHHHRQVGRLEHGVAYLGLLASWWPRGFPARPHCGPGPGRRTPAGPSRWWVSGSTASPTVSTPSTAG